MRDWFAHQLDMDAAVIGTAAKEDLPPLRDFCKQWLSLNTHITPPEIYLVKQPSQKRRLFVDFSKRICYKIDVIHT